MKFKFGVTTMNTHFPNYPNSFDILDMLDTDDSYHNTKHGLFYMWENNLNCLFSKTNGLNIIVVKIKEHAFIKV